MPDQFVLALTLTAATVGARKVRFAWLDRYGDAIAGAAILCLGTLVTVLGI